MKGMILAGGLATRLRPLTWVTNKHLLPIYKKPMIYYSLETMKKAGIKEVLLSTSPDHAGHFANLLKSGEEFGLRLYYAIQENPTGGIAEGIALGEEFIDRQKVLVLLGDGIFSYNLSKSVQTFEKKEKGAKIFGMRMKKNLKQYGIVEMNEEGKVLSIEEKPENPKSDIAQTGIYMYDSRVFDFIRMVKPSERGQLEVTDVNNIYLKEENLECELINWWIDAGTSHDELLRANILAKEKYELGEL